MQSDQCDNSTKRAALIAAVMASFITPFMGSSINIALPSIGDEFSMDAILIGWVATSYLLGAAVFLVPAGKLSDIIGRKKIFTWGFAVYSIGSLLCGLATGSFSLILYRIIQSIGSAMIFSTGIAILTSVYPVGERGKVLGISVASVYFGLTIGPFLGGVMTDQLGWRSIFLANVLLGLITLVVVMAMLKGEWAESRGDSFDLGGSVIYGISLAAIIYGLSVLPAPTGLWLLIAGLVGIFIFIALELRIRTPVLDIKLFKGNLTFGFSNLAALLNYSATFGVTFLMSLYLQDVRGFNPQYAGLILIAQPVMMTVFSPFAGKLSDRIEPQVVASVGMAILAAGLSALVFVTELTPIWLIVIILLVFGLGYALFSSPNTNAIMSSVEKRYYGVASATLATMRMVGQMLSMGIAMLVFSLIIGKVEITPDIHDKFMVSMKTAFVIFAALCVVGIFASLARGKIRPVIRTD